MAPAPQRQRHSMARHAKHATVAGAVASGWLDLDGRTASGGHRQPGAIGGHGVRGQRAKAVADRRPAKREVSLAVDYGALAQFRYQLRKFLAFSEAAAQKAGLTPQQHQALLAIKGFSDPGAISVGDLARVLLIKHHTAVELMDRMTKLGLLSRIVDDNDGRRVLLKLTARAEQKLRRLSKIHFEELTSASPGLTKILKSFQRSRSR
jgi:DNA-binding MarR family transcriptional regulator